MLTRELCLFRIRDGVLRPSFVKAEDAKLLELAAALVSVAAGAPGHPIGEVEERLGQLALGAAKPKVARGLVKLLVDRMEVEPSSEDAVSARLDRLRAAAATLRALPPGATMEAYERALGGGLSSTREALYADLPARRRVCSWESLSAKALLHRYNLALAQGPLLGARAATLRVLQPQTLRLRKLLRWLRFCRLVAEVQQVGDDWLLELTGPAALLTQQKRYGLQLASFLTAVPLLQAFELTAEVGTPRKRVALRLTHEDPLVCPHPQALGHIPPEVTALRDSFQAQGWTLDPAPPPRHTGAKGLCVPDFAVSHESGRRRWVELFHPWHAGPLARRLEELRARPDPELLLGVDRALLKSAGLKAKVEGHGQVFLFNGFPTARRLLAHL